MASTAVLEHVLRKISAAIEQHEVLRADARISSLPEALTSFKEQVEMSQIPDLGVETSEEMVWRRSVFHMAWLVEDFVDLSTCPIDDLWVDRVWKRKIRRWMLQAPSAIHQEITDLSQSQPGGHSPRPESSGPTVGCYDPCLPVPTVEAELLGVGGATEKLGSLLLDGEKHLKTLSVVGFAGMGKTSLAMEVYRKSEAGFECRATASVSRKPDMKQLLQHILSEVRPEAPQCSDASPQLQQLIEEIREHLQDKRYLVLLDDMWESLPEIESALPKNNCCSRIIMTTPIKKLAELGPCGCDVTVYEMEPLGVADLENLLSGETGCEDCLNAAASISDGVPLAAVPIARLVEERYHPQNYEQQMAAPEVPRRISVSYIDLDPCHRTHMIFLCMFPWNFQIESKLLVQLWKAEGYANSASSGEDILKELIDRNVILPVNRKDISQVVAWKVHFLMLQFILRHSAGDNFLITSSSKHWSAPANKVRRLALHSRYSVEFQNWLGELDLSFISSLFIFGKANRVPLDQFCHLRVLNIIGWKHLKDDDLKHICHMFLLRYLSLKNTQVSKIPPIISNLRYLETLDVRKTRVTELPRQVGQLPKLTDLLVGSDEYPSSDTRVKIPTGFRYFESLKTLETIHLSDAWLLLDSLQHLTEMAIMCPFRESRYSQENLCRSLKQCYGLKSLTFYGGLGCSMDFLHSLHDPPSDITKLRVTGRLIRIPKWIATLKNLVHLQIKVCQLCPGDLQKLGELHRLEHLLLGLDFLPEQEIVVAGFPTLERFSVDCRVPWLNFEPGVMPKLAELELKFREGPGNQQCVPSGINHLVNLKRVAIYYSSWCQSSTSVQATVKAMVVAVREHPRPVKLFINGSRCSDINGEQAEIREHATQNYSSHAEPRSSP